MALALLRVEEHHRSCKSPSGLHGQPTRPQTRIGGGQTRFGPRDVEETSIVAVPASALNPGDGSVLAKITDDLVSGQNNVTVNLYGPGPTLVASLVTGQSGCALFANITPGTYTATAFETGWIDSNNDLSSGNPAPLGAIGTSMTGNVVAAGTVTLPATAPSAGYYAQAANVYATYSAPSPYNIPVSGLPSLPLSFYNTGLVNNPYIAAAATVAPGDPVFAFHTSPSYTVVAGSCGGDSVPNGGVLADGVAVPTAGSIAPGSTTAVGINLAPVIITVQNNSGVPQLGASVTATATTPTGALDSTNCSANFPMPVLGLGNTSAAAAVGGVTTTTVTSSAVPSISPSPLTFTATVAPGGSATVAPTGTVTFKVDGATVGSSALSGGVATYTDYGISIAAHLVTAIYSGDTNFTGSTSGSFAQSVVGGSPANPTATAITSSAPTSMLSAPVTLTAWVAPSGATDRDPDGDR